MRGLYRIEWLKTNFKAVKSPEGKTNTYHINFFEKDNSYRSVKTKNHYI